MKTHSNLMASVNYLTQQMSDLTTENKYFIIGWTIYSPRCPNKVRYDSISQKEAPVQNREIFNFCLDLLYGKNYLKDSFKGWTL